MNRLVIVGAGGHGKVVADCALKNGYRDILFVDDKATGECLGFPVAGVCAELDRLDDGRTDFIIGIGSNAVRKALAAQHNVNWTTLIHPSAQIGLQVTVGRGTVIMAGAVVNACSTIGEHCIINSNAVVEHDNQVGDYVHIAPGVHLGGTVAIGDMTQIGIGSTVINNVNVIGDCIVGGGSLVIRDIVEKGTYIGVSTRKIK